MSLRLGHTQTTQMEPPLSTQRLSVAAPTYCRPLCLPSDDTYIEQTLGVAHTQPLPAKFYADVFLFYDLTTCLMQEIRAFATIPTEIGGQPIDPPILDTLLRASPIA